MDMSNNKTNGKDNGITSGDTKNEAINGNNDRVNINSNQGVSSNNHHYTITIIAFLVLFFLIFVAYVFFLPHHGPTATECEDKDLVNAMMIELNAINNVLTWCSFIVATITIVAAIAGIAIFSEFRKRIDSDVNNAKTRIKTFEKTVNERIDLIDKKIDDCCEEAKQKMQSLGNAQIRQERYFKKSIDYLYTISANLSEREENSELLDILYHDLQVIRLYTYQIDQDNNESKYVSHQKKAALEYLKDNGTIDDISDLEYVSQNDSSDDIKRRAQEVIGIIKHRFNKS